MAILNMITGVGIFVCGMIVGYVFGVNAKDIEVDDK